MLTSPAGLVGLVLFLLLTPIHSHPISKSCAPTCDFQLCSKAKLSLLSSPSSPITPPICLEGRPVHVTSSGEAFVRSGASYYSLISRSGPSSKQCAPNFFTTYPTSSGAAAIGYDPSPGTDYSFLAGKCIALPLNSVQLVSPGGLVLHEMELEGRPLQDCVGFEVSSDIPSPPTSPDYEVAALTPAPPTPIPEQRVDDVSDGARSALDIRKHIMNEMESESDEGKQTSPIVVATPAPTTALAAPVAAESLQEELAVNEEPIMSAEPMDEPSEAPGPSEEPLEDDIGEEGELFQAMPFSM